jgi:23S rRNA pseudouridine1911/1915/1917 synthase
MKLTILFEDDHIVAIDKPAGLLSIPERFDRGNIDAASLLKVTYPDLHVIHRLDRDTSGVMIFAKNAEAHAFLSQAFESRDVSKFYLAIVNGIPPEEGEINAPLAESLTKRGTMVVTKKGKESLSKYRLIKDYQICSLVEVQIFTGRMHQIRVHMAYEGYPLFVDAIYGSRENFFLSEIKGRKYKISKNEEEELPLLHRQTLHAHRLAFPHPSTHEMTEVISPMPKDFRALINQLEKMKR